MRAGQAVPTDIALDSIKTRGKALKLGQTRSMELRCRSGSVCCRGGQPSRRIVEQQADSVSPGCRRHFTDDSIEGVTQDIRSGSTSSLELPAIQAVTPG